MTLWTPSVANLARTVELDASVSSSVHTDAYGVYQWDDLSGNGYHAVQATNSKKPILTASGLNGLAITTYNGAWNINCASFNKTLTAESVFVVFRYSTGGTNQRIFSQSDGNNDWSTSGGYIPLDRNVGNNEIGSECQGEGRVGVLSVSNNTYCVMASIHGASTITNWLNDNTSASGSHTLNKSFTNYSLGNGAGGVTDGPFYGDIAAIIVLDYAANTNLRNTIFGYLAWKYGLQTSLPSNHPFRNSAPQLSGPVASYVIQNWSISNPVSASIDELYGVKLGAILDQNYIIWPFFQAVIDQIYGIKLGSTLSQVYFDAPIIKNFLDQPYRDANQLQQVLIQKWGDAARITGYLDQDYALPEFLQRSMEQLWAITATEIRNTLAELYNISQHNLISSILEQTYVIAPAGSLYYRPVVSVTVDGMVVTPSHINIECSRDENVMTCELTLYNQTDYLICALLAEIVIVIDTEEYSFLVNPKPSRNRNVGETTYTVKGESRAILLDSPFSEQLKQQIGPGMASSLVSDLAAMEDIDIQWEIVDWYIPAETLYANDETPLAIIRKIVAAAGAILQSDPDGTLRATPYYPCSVPDWEVNTPDFYLTDQDNFFTLSENPETRPGYNKYTISDQLSSQSGVTLEEKQISDTVKEIKAYQVPWDGLNRPLLHSGGPWVRIEPMGSAMETITAEQIEIVNGTGKTSKPIYAMIHREYKQVVLGVISFSEDGTLKTEIVGESLVQATYQTMYWKFRVTDNQKEAVQCYVEELSA